MLPLSLSSLRVRNAEVRAVHRVDSQNTRLEVAGDVGADAVIVLPGFNDLAGNTGEFHMNQPSLMVFQSGHCSVHFEE